jgi:1-deoxy-D-xylulose-5-phosphate reductoisomerase
MGSIDLVVLGSTGSIGQSCLEIVRAHRDRINVVGLAASANTELLAAQAEEFQPRYLGLADEAKRSEFEARLPSWPAGRLLFGREAATELARLTESQVVLNAIVGAAGLESSLTAAECGKTLLLANKESLVIGGELLMKTVKAHGATLLPVDSEHNSIYRCLRHRDAADVSDIYLTASGGPLLKRGGVDNEESVTIDDVLNHPTWRMGRRVTVDSATLLNKGFEVIEARWLFACSLSHIHVMIHPQSILHGLVAFSDGSMIAHLSVPSMKIPLSYCLLGVTPPGELWEQLDLARVGQLDFSEPDVKQFPCLGIALEAARTGGTAPAALNAADEVAVAAFLDSRLEFGKIPDVLSIVLDAHQVETSPTFEALMRVDSWARHRAAECITQMIGNCSARES